MEGAPSLLLSIILAWTCMGAVVVSSDFSVTLLHTNDVHARIEQTDKRSGTCSPEEAAAGKCYGGVARRWSQIQKIRNTTRNVLLLDGGDQFQGTLWFYYYKGLEASHFLNKMDYHAMALGNHEFDNGVTGLLPFLQNATFPVLSSNIDASGEPNLYKKFLPSINVTIAGQAIGIVGYTTQETPELVDPVGVKKLVFKDEVKSVQAEVQKLRAAGINKIIALGHAGIETDKQVAMIEGVDVVVGGHSNTFLYTGTPPSIEEPYGDYPLVVEKASGTRVPVVQAYAYGKYLGRLDLTFNDQGDVTSFSGNPILLDASKPEDPEMAADVDELRKPLETLAKEVVGESRVLLDGASTTCRAEECNMGNMLTDAMVYQLLRPPTEETWNVAGVAMWNGGGIRASLNKGNFTLEEVLTVLPFRNEVEMVTLQGSVFLEMLEHSVSRVDMADKPGRFLQMSGVHVTYDIRQPPGSRVKEVMIRCTSCAVPDYEVLIPSKDYKVITSKFLIDGGDGYTMIRDKHTNRSPFGLVAADILGAYGKRRSPIIQGREGRIRFWNGDDCASSAASLWAGHTLTYTVMMCVIAFCSFLHR